MAVRVARATLSLFSVSFFLAACSMFDSRSLSSVQDGPPARRLNAASIRDAVPKAEPRSRYGNPESYEVMGRHYHVMPSADAYEEVGIASWYGKKFHGRRTSSGEIYDLYAMTAAHPRLPLPTYVEVTNLKNGKVAIVKVNDRGPFHGNRIIDLSYAAAVKLGIDHSGTGRVRVRAIDTESTSPLQTDHASPPVQSAAGARHQPPMRVAIANGIRKPFFIQFGAFSDWRNAQSLRHHLRMLPTRSLRIHTLRLQGRAVYQVRVGPLRNISDANRIITQSRKLGVHEHRIIAGRP